MPVSQCTNLILISDVDQNTQMFGLHERLINASSPRTYKSSYKKEIKQR